MRATIKDIAAATGFSVTTISLVLNGKGYKISDETKNQILAKARELNYRPNQLAVSLVKRQSKTIGFIVPDISNALEACGVTHNDAEIVPLCVMRENTAVMTSKQIFRELFLESISVAICT